MLLHVRGGARQEIAFDAIPIRGEGIAFDAIPIRGEGIAFDAIPI